MGYEYALVHLIYTIPPAVLLSALYYPLFTRLDLYKLGFLIAIAVFSTIPWDSYLIQTGVWSYPPNVIVGPTLYYIPLEEVFFFVIQTFNTTLLYLILSKPVLKEAYLVKEGSDRDSQKWKYIKVAGQVLLGLGIRYGVHFIQAGGSNTYLGLILVWALPFLLLLWSLAYQFILRLPLAVTVLPIALPTVYLWIVDTLALRRGTWVIAAGTKTGLSLWPGLEIEEALFFLLTNTLITCGLLAFDNALAILHAFPAHFPRVPTLPSPLLLVRALLLPARTYDDDRIRGLAQAVARLRKKSRSFYLASSTFPGRLRIDLILLYSFCRVADDLIDHAPSTAEARAWLAKLTRFVDLSYAAPTKDAHGHAIAANDANRGAATLFVAQNFPSDTHLALMLLPTPRLDKEPLYELLQGFRTDLQFSSSPSSSSLANVGSPIKSEADLDLYASRVAGTVALLCIQLVLHHHHSSGAPPVSDAQARRLLAAGHDMGLALQYTNIARDLRVDAHAGRCYVPASWLAAEKLVPAAFVAGLVADGKKREEEKQKEKDQSSLAIPSTAGATAEKEEIVAQDAGLFAKKVATLRARLLERAFKFYRRSVGYIEELPAPARPPMRVAVESYMQIARELRAAADRARRREDEVRRRGVRVEPSESSALVGLREKADGRATVPVWKRVWVAWWALLGPTRRP